MVYLACDHAGFALMQKVIEYLKESGIEYEYIGATELDPSDSYATYALKANKKIVEDNNSRGIYICGTGFGICMAANRCKVVRATRCSNKKEVIATRKHNNCNVLVLGGRTLKLIRLKGILKAFFETEFEGGRHQGRLDEMNKF